jgi:hypothetical protein
MDLAADRPRCHHVRPVSSDGEITADRAHGTDDEDVEVVDGVPVLTEVRTLEPLPAAAVPAVQTAAAAATGFVAGAATLALVRLIGGRRAARARVSRRRSMDGLPIIGTRSFLIDIHMLSKPGE